MKSQPPPLERHVRAPPAERPLMVYDGDCDFCRHWIARWRRATGDQVDYLSFQETAGQFPEIPRAAFEEAVQLIEPSGRVLNGADAVFRALDFAPRRRWFLQLLPRLPGFMPVARLVYGFIARHRPFFSWMTRLFFSA